MSFTVRFRSYSVGTHSGTPLHRIIDPDHGILKRGPSPERRDVHRHRRRSSHASHDADYAYDSTKSTPRRSSISTDTKTTTISSDSGTIERLNSTQRGVDSREDKGIRTSRRWSSASEFAAIPHSSLRTSHSKTDCPGRPAGHRVPNNVAQAHNERPRRFSNDIYRTSAYTPHRYFDGIDSKPSVASSPGFVTLHPYLTDTLLRWDIRYPPSSATYINAFAGSPEFSLDVHATFPVTSQIMLQLKHLSVPGCGTLIVNSSVNSGGITVRHVLDAVYTTFNKPLDFGDYARMELGQYVSVMKTYKRRRAETGLPFSQALRLDVLAGRTSFLGLSMVDLGHEVSSKVKLLLA